MNQVWVDSHGRILFEEKDSSWRAGGVNYTAEEAEHLMALRMIGLCSSRGKFFSVGNVKVVARYADCSVFVCPVCGSHHDDRQSWTGDRNQRNGYSEVYP